jgi:hypothetical protein
MVNTMKTTNRNTNGATVPPEILGERGLDALQRLRFKEAVDLFKQVIRTDPSPKWKEALADAYEGRARDLAAKGMFKEAAMVLENTMATGGATAPVPGGVRDPSLYLSCLIRDSQQQKAAVYVLNHLPERPNLQALAAALLVSVPRLPDLTAAASPEQRRWHALAAASRAALAAWCDRGAPEEIDRHLNGISLRSAFRPVRVLLNTLIRPPEDAERTRLVLDTIPPGSPFHPLRQAVAASVSRDSGLDADSWRRLAPLQQSFVAETAGLTQAASQFLARLAEAERGGSGALFNFLMKRTDLPRTEVRSACLNLLPRLPDHVSRFEKSFGELSFVEHQRLQALTAESRGNWEAAGRAWSATAAAFAEDGGSDRMSGLACGVIYRHLSNLAEQHQQIEADDDFCDPVVRYLEQACSVDPDYLPGRLELIGHYREDAASDQDPSTAKTWHQMVDETVRRFPEDARVLQQALDSALARKAFKQASGFARRLLQINAINPGVRRQMIELQISYARKQMRAKRADLAMKALNEAAEWERADKPSPQLRIVRALVELHSASPDQARAAEARLRAGVALAGGGVVGWFRTRLEADLLKSGGRTGFIQQELARARETPASTDEIMAVVAAVGQPEAGENKKVVAALLTAMQTWLQQGAALAWQPAEFQAVAEVLARFEMYGLLVDYAQAARQRDPANPVWRFHAIVGRTRGKADRLSVAEQDDLMALAEAAARREDFHMATRIARFLDGETRKRRRSRRRVGRADDDDLDDGDAIAMLGAVLSDMPKGAAADLRQLVNEVGREKAITTMVEQLRGVAGGDVPVSALREFCAAAVARALGGVPSRPGSSPYGMPF